MKFRQIGFREWVFEQLNGGWCLSNAGLILGEEASLMIDSAATQKRARSLRREVWSLLDGNDPDSIVLTHFHGDHSFGVNEFKKTKRIISTTRTSELLQQNLLRLTELWPDVDWGEVSAPSPNETFTDRYSLDLGNCLVEVIDFSAAHSGSDSVVWLPDSGILYTGDLVMSGVAPFFLFGSAVEMLRVLEQLKKLSPVVVVPGHGASGGLDLIEDNLQYIFWCLDIAENARRIGCNPEEIADTISRRDSNMNLIDSERIVANLYRAQADLDGIDPGGTIDYQKAFAAMIDFAGGRLECNA